MSKDIRIKHVFGRRHYVIAILLGLVSTLQAQLPKGMYLESSVHAGMLIKHRSYITIDYSKPSFGTELNIEFETYGKKDWHERSGFPQWGIALSYQHLGNEKHLGSAIGVIPNITINMLKKKKFRLFTRLGMGLAIVTKPHNKVTNPENNVIGSYLNNNTSFRLGAAWRFQKHLELRPSVAFTHYSNAASQLPNLGVNILSFQLGLCYLPNPVTKEDYQYKSAEEAPKRNKRIQFSYTATFGFREMETNSGPKYGIGHTSLDAGLFVSKNNRLKAGIEYDYIGSVYAFLAHNGGYADRNLFWESSRLSLYLADEIMIGRFAVLAQVGFYVTDHKLQPWFMVVRLSARYYLTDPYHNKPAPFVTVTMKSHKIVAEYVSLGMGIAF